MPRFIKIPDPQPVLNDLGKQMTMPGGELAEISYRDFMLRTTNDPHFGKQLAMLDVRAAIRKGLDEAEERGDGVHVVRDTDFTEYKAIVERPSVPYPTEAGTAFLVHGTAVVSADAKDPREQKPEPAEDEAAEN